MICLQDNTSEYTVIIATSEQNVLKIKCPWKRYSAVCVKILMAFFCFSFLLPMLLKWTKLTLSFC